MRSTAELDRSPVKNANTGASLSLVPKTSEADLWAADLRSAGWTRFSDAIYQSPEGLLVRGAFRAWLSLRTSSADSRSADKQQLDSERDGRGYRFSKRPRIVTSSS